MAERDLEGECDGVAGRDLEGVAECDLDGEGVSVSVRVAVLERVVEPECDAAKQPCERAAARRGSVVDAMSRCPIHWYKQGSGAQSIAIT